MRFVTWLLLLLLTAGVFAQGTERKIAPGDRIRMTVAEEPNLNKNYTVTADGLMLIDFLGAVPVAGLTIRDAAERITKRFVDERFLRRATISMEFLNTEAPASQRVKVSGEVKQKGEIVWTSGMRLSDVIRMAEPLPTADLTKIVVVTSGASSTVDYSRFNPATNFANPLMKAGDEVRFPNRAGQVAQGGGTTPPVVNPGQGTTPPVVNPNPGQGTVSGPSTGTVFVLGGVNRPGAVSFAAGMTARQAITAAGGFSPRGDQAKVRVERAGAASPIALDLSVAGVDAPLQANDQIVVEVTSQKRYLQVVGAVRSPGLVEFFEGISLSQAIMVAGGLEQGARANDVRISSPGGASRKINYDDVMRGYRGEPILQAGDIIEVPGARGSRVNANQGPAPTGAPARKRDNTAVTVLGIAALAWLLFRR